MVRRELLARSKSANYFGGRTAFDLTRPPMTFTLPQFGIFARGTPAHHFLEFDFRLGFTRDQAVASFRRLRTPDVSAGGVNLVVAFGADAWRPPRPGVRSSGCL